MTRGTNVGGRGQFNEDIQGATSKFALNAGLRPDAIHKETLARMFVPVLPDERVKYLESIGDTHVQSQLAPQLSGLVSLTGDLSGPSGSAAGNRREAPPVRRTGYVDFFIQRAQHTLRENFQVSPTLEGNYVVYSFDQQPPVFPYSGVLINTKQDDQASNFFRLYIHIFRLAQLAKRQKELVLRYDSYIIKGAVTEITMDYSAETQIVVPFSFNLLVKQIMFVNYTINWRPTSPSSSLSDDPNAVVADRPQVSRAATTSVATTPLNTELAPTDRQDADLRTQAEVNADIDSGETASLPTTSTPTNASPPQVTIPPAPVPTTPPVVTPPAPPLVAPPTPVTATARTRAVTRNRPEVSRPPTPSAQTPAAGPRANPPYRAPTFDQGDMNIRGERSQLQTATTAQVMQNILAPREQPAAGGMFSQAQAADALARIQSGRRGVVVVPEAPEF